MGCQKWLCLCAHIFLTYFWQSKECGLKTTLYVTKSKLPTSFHLSKTIYFKSITFCHETPCSTNFSDCFCMKLFKICTFFSVTKTPESCKWSWRFNEAHINFLSQFCKQLAGAYIPKFGSIPWAKWASLRAWASTQAVLVCSTRWGPLGLQGSWFYLAPERTRWRTCLWACTNAGK